jgi:hypothetical protein
MMTTLLMGRIPLAIIWNRESQFAEDAMSDDHCCAEVDATESCFHWKGQDEMG